MAPKKKPRKPAGAPTVSATKLLTNYQEQFAFEYIECGDRNKAYERAYPGAANMARRTIYQRSHETFHLPHVQARIKEIRDAVTKDPVDVLRRMVEKCDRIIETDIPDIFIANAGKLSLEEWQKLTKEERYCVKDYKRKKTETKDGYNEHIQVTLYSKLEAIDTKAKLLGMYKQNVNVSPNDRLAALLADIAKAGMPPPPGAR